MDEARSEQVGSTQIDLSALTAHFKSVNIRGGAGGSLSFSQGDGDRVEGPPQALRPTFRSDYAPADVTYGSSTCGPVAGEHQHVPTAETGPDHVRQTTAVVTEAEAKTVRIAKILRLMRDNDSRTEEHLRALEMLMNPPTVAPVVDSAAPMFFLDGSLAYDEELGRLQEARRKASGSAKRMGEMEGDSFTANLFDRQTGQTVSALEARWNPECGNRGELEARIGAIISEP